MLQNADGVFDGVVQKPMLDHYKMHCLGRSEVSQKRCLFWTLVRKKRSLCCNYDSHGCINFNLPVCNLNQEVISYNMLCTNYSATKSAGYTLRSAKSHPSALQNGAPSYSLYIKSIVSNLLGLSGGGRSRFYKMFVHACVTTKCSARDTRHPKPGHHASNLCFVVERNSEHGFFQLGWNLTIGQKEQERSRMGYIRTIISNRM